MAQALLTQGLTALRDALKATVTNVGISTDGTAFAVGQTAINPSGTGTNLIKAATNTNVDSATFDATMTINGSSEFTGSTFQTVSLLNGSLASNAISRTLRSGVGVQAGDSFTVGIRVTVQDNS